MSWPATSPATFIPTPIWTRPRRGFSRLPGGGIPDNIPSFAVPRSDATPEGTYPAARLMVMAGLEASLGAARRTITGKGLKVDGRALPGAPGSLDAS